MTFAEMAAEAVFVAAVKTLVAFCLAYSTVIGWKVLRRGRGAESVWPDGPEPRQADDPASNRS